MSVPVFKRFEISRVLGTGGMGVVYEAMDSQLGGAVALKTLQSLSPAALVAFKNEFREVQHIAHPNLVALYDLFQDEGSVFYTMELVEGVELLEYVWGRDPGPGAPSPTLSQVDMSRASAVTSRWGTGPPPVSLPRLASCTAQLVEGLSALHRHGVVHCDVKSGNVLVTASGVVKLLDFGLARAVERRLGIQRRVTGTVGSMAPEQAAGGQLTSATDLYAVGVLMYEALTGQPPFVGEAAQVLLDKQRREAPDVRELKPDTPEPLRALVRELLDFEPERRPNAAQVLYRLGAQRRRPEITGLSFGGEHSFVGREPELQALMAPSLAPAPRAFQATAVVGASGLGKTALLHRALDTLGAQVPELLALASSCREHEAVPYKALDGAVDALYHHLVGLGREEVRRLMPPRAEVLARFFPVLGGVPGFRAEDGLEVEENEPSAQRRAFMAAMRGLFSSLASRGPVVLAIDDLQWADEDSWAVLREVFGQAGAPPVHLLLTVRPEGESTVASWRQRLAGELGGRVEVLELQPLEALDAQALALSNLRYHGLPLESAEDLVREAQGHPLFLEVFARALAAPGGVKPATLDEAVAAVLKTLDEASLAVATLAAVSAGPLPVEVLRRAVDQDPATLQRVLSGLVVSHVLTSGTAVEPWHDRIRRALLAQQSVSLPALHSRLAQAYEAGGAKDVEALAYHLFASGQARRAVPYAAQAAERAEAVAAYARAVEHWRSCLEAESQPEARARYARRLGEALGALGFGNEAAQAFVRAAELAPPSQATELRRRAADFWLQSGRIDEGLGMLERVLRDLGLTLPRSTLACVGTIIRCQLAARWEDWRAKVGLGRAGENLLDAARSETLFSASTTLVALDPVLGAAVQALSDLYARTSGSPLQRARSLCMSAITTSLRGVTAEAAAWELVQRAEAMVQGEDAVELSYLSLLARGIIPFEVGKLDEARGAFDQALKVQRGSATFRREQDSLQIFHSVTRVYQGDFGTLKEDVEGFREEAARRDDVFHLSQLGVSSIVSAWLARGEVVNARQVVDRSAGWPSRMSFHPYYVALARALLGLYEGDYSQAQATYEAAIRRSANTFIMRVQKVRIDGMYIRALLALAAQGRAALPFVRRTARALKAEGSRLGSALAAALEAVEKPPGAMGEVGECFEALGMYGFASSARWMAGVADRAYFHHARIAEPARFARLWMPAPLTSAALAG